MNSTYFMSAPSALCFGRRVRKSPRQILAGAFGSKSFSLRYLSEGALIRTLVPPEQKPSVSMKTRRALSLPLSDLCRQNEDFR